NEHAARAKPRRLERNLILTSRNNASTGPVPNGEYLDEDELPILWCTIANSFTHQRRRFPHRRTGGYQFATQRRAQDQPAPSVCNAALPAQGTARDRPRSRDRPKNKPGWLAA